MSSLNTLAETARLLAFNPSTVVMSSPPRNAPVNQKTHNLVLHYVQSYCDKIATVSVPERERTDDITVWGDCEPSDKRASTQPNDRSDSKDR